MELINITPETSPVVQYYNQLTYIEDKFDILNYISSFKYSRYGLLLAYALLDLERYGVEFTIVAGYDSNDPDRSNFKLVTLSIKNNVDTELLTDGMSDDTRKYYDHFIGSELSEGGKMYLVLN